MYYTQQIIIIILFIFTIVSLKLKFEKYIVILSEILLIMIFGFSYQYGTDWYNYERMFYEIESSDRLEIGYKILSYIFRSLFETYEIFQIIIIVINIILFYITIKKIIYKYRMFAVFAYFNVILFSITQLYRQGLSISFFNLGVYYYLNKKKLSIVYFFIAILFHKSAIIPIVLIYFSSVISLKIKMSINRLIILTIMILIFPYKEMLINLAILLKRIGLIFFYDKILSYINKPIIIGLTLVIKVIENLIIGIVVVKDKDINERIKKIFFIFYFFNLIVFFNPVFRRVSMYWSLIFVFIIINILKNKKRYLVGYAVYNFIYLMFAEAPRGELNEKYKYYNYFQVIIDSKKKDINKKKMELYWNEGGNEILRKEYDE